MLSTFLFYYIFRKLLLLKMIYGFYSKLSLYKVFRSSFEKINDARAFLAFTLNPFDETELENEF
jgi:hypothetical protein